MLLGSLRKRRMSVGCKPMSDRFVVSVSFHRAAVDCVQPSASFDGRGDIADRAISFYAPVAAMKDRVGMLTPMVRRLVQSIDVGLLLSVGLIALSAWLSLR